MSRFLTSFLALSISVYAVAVAYSQTADAAGEPRRLSAHGTVMDPDGKPVAGARVVLREWPTIRRSDDPYLKEVRDVLAETKSDENGRFEFTRVASRPFGGFRDDTPWDVVALVDGFAPGWVHLPDDDRELTVQLSAARSIQGRLIDSDGNPIADCRVHVAVVDALRSQWHSDFRVPSHFDLWHSEISPRSTTDEDGRFEIVGLPAEQRLTLYTEHPRFANSSIYAATTDSPQSPLELTTFRDGQPTTVEKPVHRSGFTETLAPGRQVRGRVVLADTGKPVPDAKVIANWDNRALYATADDAGHFEFNGMPEPEWHISTSTDVAGYLGAREHAKFAEGEWMREIEVKLPRGQVVRGRVVDEVTGAGVEGVGVRYAESTEDERSGWSPAKTATTDAAGAFEIVVPAGPGMLQVYGGTERHPTHDVPDHWRLQRKQSLAPFHSAEINVGADESGRAVTLKVGRGLVIRGQVVDGVGEPVFAAVVQAKDRFGRSGLEKKTITDDQGRFELAGFPPHEEQQLEIIDAASRSRADARIAADEKSGPSRLVELPPIQLSGTGRVVGKVLGDGKPLAGVSVSLSRALDPSGGPQSSPIQLNATTDKDGRFEFDAVDASHRFFLYAMVDGYTSQGTTNYSVAVGEETEVPPIELKSRSTFVAGIVVDPDGKPVAGVTVSASERNGASISYGRNGPPEPTGPDGRFRLEDLPNVPLTLMAYIRAAEGTKDRAIHFPAHVNAEPKQTDVRILLDPKLQRPLP